MKRTTLHMLFTCVTFCLLVLTLWNAYTLYDNRRVISKVSAVPEVMSEEQQDTVPDSHPAVLLATASALSAGNQFEATESILVKLIDQQQLEPLGQASRFNLANHYLRQGLRKDLPGAQTRPLIEIAKQRYRDLLQANPDDWDARVNLEHALRVAPELPSSDRDKGPPVKSVNVIVPDFTLKDLP